MDPANKSFAAKTSPSNSISDARAPFFFIWDDVGIVVLALVLGSLSGGALTLAFLTTTWLNEFVFVGALALIAALTIALILRARNARQREILETLAHEKKDALETGAVAFAQQRAQLESLQVALEHERAQVDALETSLEHERAHIDALEANLAARAQNSNPLRVPRIYGWHALNMPETESAAQWAILAELFHDQEEIHIQKKFSGGHRNRGVYLVRASAEVDRVVKIARAADIRAERRAQDLVNRYMQNNGGQYVRDAQRAEDDAYGGIVYRLASLRRSAALLNFDAFYRETPGLAACVAVIEQLYNEMLPHSLFRHSQAAPLFREHALPERALKKIAALARQELGLSDEVLESEHVRVMFGTQTLTVRNPLVWAARVMPRYAELTLPASLGVVHGDLHSGNILIEQPSTNVWLIDFAKTRDGAHTLTDFARLEADLKFYLLASDAENYFEHALLFEELLRAPNAARELEIDFREFEKFGAEFQRAAACILALRRVAVQHRREGAEERAGHFVTDSVLPYYLALWQATLRTLKYEQCNRAQKTFAFVSAGMLSERITQLVT